MTKDNTQYKLELIAGERFIVEGCPVKTDNGIFETTSTFHESQYKQWRRIAKKTGSVFTNDTHKNLRGGHPENYAQYITKIEPNSQVALEEYSTALVELLKLESKHTQLRNNATIYYTQGDEHYKRREIFDAVEKEVLLKLNDVNLLRVKAYGIVAPLPEGKIITLEDYQRYVCGERDFGRDEKQFFLNTGDAYDRKWEPVRVYISQRTITKGDWVNTGDDYKGYVDGIPYLLFITNAGTTYAPIKIYED